MISSKFLATTALAAAVISTLGLAYAQTTVPTPDSARVETDKATTQPGTNGTTVITTPKTGTPSMPATMGATTTTPTTPMPMGSTTTATEPTPAAAMPAATPRDQGNSMPNANMNSSMGNASSDLSSGRSTTRKERVARADRN